MKTFVAGLALSATIGVQTLGYAPKPQTGYNILQQCKIEHCIMQNNVKQVKMVKEEKIKVNYSDDDLYLLSQIIYSEAGGESDECQLAVGSVILNRMRSNKFPDTIKGVIYQKGQYAGVNSRLWKKGADERAKKNAKYLIKNGSQLPSKVLYQTMFVPKWATVYKKIGTEYFSY